MIIEICAYNIQSCIIAARAGASRIELCTAPAYGGITPSHGAIEQAIRKVNIPIYCMIRPRGGDFVFDQDEIAIMKRDIFVCKELGCRGIATGAQKQDGNLDADLVKRMVEWAYPMGVTCHNVFDKAPDAFSTLEAVIESGCERILTAGLQPKAIEGMAVLKKLITAAAGRIIIMPGGGVRSSNLSQLIATTEAKEYHSAALTYTDDRFIADEEEVRKLVERIN